MRFVLIIILGLLLLGCQGKNAAPNKPGPQGAPASTLNASGPISATEGAVIVGQSGTTVQYKKKCDYCGWTSTTVTEENIGAGKGTSSFKCPKCRCEQSVAFSREKQP